MEINEQLYTVKQAAEALELNHKQVLRLIHKGDIMAEKLGWVWVIKEEEIQRQLASQGR